MKIKSLYILFFIIVLIHRNSTVVSQNLVINSGFENFIKCPKDPLNNPINLHKVTGWKGWANYFNTCGSIHILPKTGNGYAAIYLFGNSKYLLSGYLQGTLSAPLEKNQKYYFELYARIGTYNAGIWGIDAICVGFNNNEISGNKFIPGFCNEKGKVVVDTVNWTKISGYYTAEGGEKFILIGNPITRENVDIEVLKSYPDKKRMKKEIKWASCNSAIYYFDEITLVPVDSLYLSWNKEKLYDSINNFERFQRLNNLFYEILTEDSLQKLDPIVYIDKIIEESKGPSYINSTEEFKNRLILYSVKFLNYALLKGIAIEEIKNKITILNNSPLGQIALLSLKKNNKVVYKLMEQ